MKVFPSGKQNAPSTFSAFASTFAGGVNVATGDINADGLSDVITAQASQGGEVKFFTGSFFGFFPVVQVCFPSAPATQEA